MARMPAEIQTRLHEGVREMMLACSGIEEQFFGNQTMLSGNLLIDAINPALEQVNARRVRDIEFAFNDLEQLIAELPPGDFERFSRCIETFRSAIERLRELASLSAEVREEMRSLRAKLRERQVAHERALFRPPGAPEEPLPHDPASLHAGAAQLREQLLREGFETPTLDQLADEPDTFELRDYGILIDEIDGIAG